MLHLAWFPMPGASAGFQASQVLKCCPLRALLNVGGGSEAATKRSQKHLALGILGDGLRQLMELAEFGHFAAHLGNLLRRVGGFLVRPLLVIGFPLIGQLVQFLPIIGQLVGR